MDTLGVTYILVLGLTVFLTVLFPVQVYLNHWPD